MQQKIDIADLIASCSDEPPCQDIAIESGIDFLSECFDLNAACEDAGLYEAAHAVSDLCNLTFEDNTAEKSKKDSMIKRIISWIESVIKMIAEKIKQLFETIKNKLKGKTAAQAVSEAKSSGVTEAPAGMNDKVESANKGFEILARKRKVMDALRSELEAEEQKWTSAIGRAKPGEESRRINEFAEDQIQKIRDKYSEQLRAIDEEYAETQSSSSTEASQQTEPINFGIYQDAAKYIENAKKEVLDMKASMEFYKKQIMRHEKEYYNITDIDRQLQLVGMINICKHNVVTLNKVIYQHMQCIANATMYLSTSCRVA